jgi:hypothetical protein
VRLKLISATLPKCEVELIYHLILGLFIFKVLSPWDFILIKNPHYHSHFIGVTKILNEFWN